MYDKPSLTQTDVRQIKSYYAKRWLDPVNRIEDIFNVRRSDGSLTKLKIPEPQKQMLRDGILGKSRGLISSGLSYIGVTNKGRQLGFSVILAAEAILIAEDFPNTFIYYVATASDQAIDWMNKLDQLCRDANYYPAEIGGGPILNLKNLEKITSKNINDTEIVGLAANPSGIRGKTGLVIIFDEAAWAIRYKNQARETWKALKYIIRQGGQARIQSTPRTSDAEEFFWGMLKSGSSGNIAVHNYYCPVITNWQDLELDEPLYIELDNEKRSSRGMQIITEEEKERLIKRYSNRISFEIIPDKHIKQKAVIPYWWVSIEDLETDRQSDLEQFKQENLGVPLDETYKLIKSEWIYSNLNEGDELDDRGDSMNEFYITVDLAQVNDLTAITVTEAIIHNGETIYVERRIEETQEEYPKQRDLLYFLYLAFKPKLISIDFTGHGRPVCEMLEEKLRDNGFNPGIVKRVTFTSKSKEEMAVGFRNLIMPDPITGRSRYKWLYKLKKHEDAIRHCTRVEKQILETSIKYSGKMHGRDDHFWSKAQLALIEKPTGVPRAALGRYKKTTIVESSFSESSLTYGQKFITDINIQRTAVVLKDDSEKIAINKSRMERVRELKNLVFALKCLTNGMVICKTQNKPVKPIHCASRENCTNIFCPGQKYVDEICKRYGVDKHEVWKRQRVYETS